MWTLDQKNGVARKKNFIETSLYCEYNRTFTHTHKQTQAQLILFKKIKFQCPTPFSSVSVEFGLVSSQMRKPVFNSHWRPSWQKKNTNFRTIRNIELDISFRSDDMQITSNKWRKEWCNGFYFQLNPVILRSSFVFFFVLYSFKLRFS